MVAGRKSCQFVFDKLVIFATLMRVLTVSGGAFEDEKTVFLFVFSFVSILLMLGLMSMYTFDLIPLCSPLFSANPYAYVVV